MRVLDLFSGPGGMGTGFANNYDVQLAVDWDEDACKTYSSNHKYTQIKNEDVRDQDYTRKDFDGIIGLIGGPPCQDYSIINTKRDVESERADLLEEEMVRAIEEIDPRFAMIENVASVPRERKKAVIKKISSLGYRVVAKVVHASDYGSVQIRRRWILTAHKSRSVFPEPIDRNRVAKDILTGEPSEFSPRQTTLDKLQNLQDGKWVSLPGQSFKAYYIVDPEKPLPAVVNPSKLRYVNPDRSGYLSFSELSKAQGFPDDYEWCGTLSSKSQQLANAVPVELAEVFAKEFRKLDTSLEGYLH